MPGVPTNNTNGTATATGAGNPVAAAGSAGGPPVATLPAQTDAAGTANGAGPRSSTAASVTNRSSATGGGGTDNNDATLGAGATAGIVIGVLVLLALAAAVVFAVVRWREENYPRMTSINTVTYASSQTQHNPLYNQGRSVKAGGAEGGRALQSRSVTATLSGAG